MLKSFKMLSVAGCAALFSYGVTGAQAQTYPSKPIRLIVPYAPGGNTDILARAVAQRITDNWNTPVIVDNRGSANGVAAADISAKSAPDGYTVFVGSTREMSVNPHLIKNLPYHPVKDFAPITQGTITPILLAVHPSLPVKSVKELIGYGKANAATFSFGSPGSGTSMHLSGELLNMMAGLKAVHVPYKGGGPVTVAVLAGQEIKFGFLGMGPAIPHVRSGRVRPIALTVEKRVALLPEVPTMIESGFKDFNTNIWFSFFAPTGTPNAIIGKLNTEIKRILDSKEVNDFLLNTGVVIEPGTPAELARIMKEDSLKYEKIIKTANIKAQ